MSDTPDKRLKAQPTEVDTSPGALLLRITELLHRIEALEMDMREMKRRIKVVDDRTIRLGPIR